MKTKQFLFFLFAGILVLTGCKKEETNNGSDNLQKIQGKWSVVSIVPSTGDVFDYIEFLADGTYKEGVNAITLSIQGTYTVSGNQVTMTMVGIPVAYTIVTLTDNSLVLSYQGQTMTLKK
jgi:hypothetical protein